MQPDHVCWKNGPSLTLGYVQCWQNTKQLISISAALGAFDELAFNILMQGQLFDLRFCFFSSFCHVVFILF